MKYGYRPTREEVEHFYVNTPSATVRSAAALIGCSYANMLAAMRNYKIDAKPKTRNWVRKPAIPQLADREWLANQIKTKTYRQIARDLGTTVGNVADKLYRMGLAIPKSGATKEGLKKAFPEGRHGPLAGNWRGGRRYQLGHRGGYVLIYMPDHPAARKDGYVYEHRLVVEKRIGRFLLPSEVVHHRNGTKDDNRDENLELWASRSEHVRNHFAATKKLARYEALYGPLSDPE